MKENNADLMRLETEVKSIVEKQKDRSIAHDFSHLKRVYNLSREIALKEGANIDVVGAAALLHDLYRIESKETQQHAEQSVVLAKQILLKSAFNKKDIEKILTIIKEHSLLSSKEMPTTLESVCLFEADKIDGLGVIGVARMFQTSGQNGWSIEKTIGFFIENYFSRYSKLSLKHTKTGRELASERIKVSLAFLKTLLAELNIDNSPLGKIAEVYSLLNRFGSDNK